MCIGRRNKNNARAAATIPAPGHEGAATIPSSRGSRASDHPPCSRGNMMERKVSGRSDGNTADMGWVSGHAPKVNQPAIPACAVEGKSSLVATAMLPESSLFLPKLRMKSKSSWRYLAIMTVAAALSGSASAALTPPKPIQPMAQPTHPPELWAKAIEGHAKIAFSIDAEGKVGNVTVVEATDPAFGEAAKAAAEQWTFTPAMRDGVPVVLKRVEQVINFPVSPMQKFTVMLGREVEVSEPDSVVDVKDLDQPPAATQEPAAEYPEKLAGSGKSGSVDMEFLLDPEGNPVNVKIAKGSGEEALDLAAVLAVLKSHWTPATKDGKPVFVRMSATVEVKEGK